jgi:hypothetical protein
MDEETKKRFEALEAKIADVKADEAFHFEQIKKNFTIVQNRMEEQIESSTKVETLLLSAIKQISKDLERLQKHEDSNLRIFKNMDEHLNFHGECLADTGLDIIKLFEAYYHVFPERVRQDAQVSKQLAALRSKRTRDAGPVKE